MSRHFGIVMNTGGAGIAKFCHGAAIDNKGCYNIMKKT